MEPRAVFEVELGTPELITATSAERAKARAGGAERRERKSPPAFWTIVEIQNVGGLRVGRKPSP